MSKRDALIGSAAFFIIAPGVVAGLVPFLITGWRFGGDANATLMWIGGVLMVAFAAALIDCFARFALRGAGTPAPLAPTRKLVVDGLYRFVRNPMYVAVLGLIFAQALFFASAALIAYGVTIWLAFLFFVLAREEPRLKRDFPDEYPIYCQHVGRWLPRLTPWRG